MYSAGVVVGRNHDEVTTAMAAGPAIEQARREGAGKLEEYPTTELRMNLPPHTP